MISLLLACLVLSAAARITEEDVVCHRADYDHHVEVVRRGKEDGKRVRE
jgi:hypothetical protein